MIPHHFFDLNTRRSADEDSFSSDIATVGRLMWLLHGVMRAQPGRFALAFPAMRTGAKRSPGSILRVFAQEASHLAALQENIGQHMVVRDYARFGYVQRIPAGFAGEMIEYHRFRIPNQKTRLGECRSRRMDAADELPFIRFVSKSNTQGFSLYIEPRPPRVAVLERAQCEPDSYGLSVSDRPFALPHLPLAIN